MFSKHLFACGLLLSSFLSVVQGGTCTCPVPDTSIIVANGTAAGQFYTYNNISMYVTKPCGVNQTDTAVLLLTDVFGIQELENKLLVDSFARAGFVAVAPDLFNGKPAPMDLNNPAFNQTAFLAQHDTPATDPIVTAGVSFLRTQLGAKKVAVTGYCFGGRYAIRSVSKVGALGADVAFAAHPSLWQNPELGNVTNPLGVGLADGDALNPPAKQADISRLLLASNATYQINLYSHVGHGFAAKANASDARAVYAKNDAFFQAVKWFTSFA